MGSLLIRLGGTVVLAPGASAFARAPPVRFAL